MREVQTGYQHNTSTKDDYKKTQKYAPGNSKTIQSYAISFRSSNKGYAFECIDNGVLNGRELW